MKTCNHSDSLQPNVDKKNSQTLSNKIVNIIYYIEKVKNSSSYSPFLSITSLK